MANGDFNPQKLIKSFQNQVVDLVGDDNTPDEELAIASALLGVVVPLYEKAMGTERTATMMYNVADELAIRVPLKIKFPRNKTRKKTKIRKRKK